MPASPPRGPGAPQLLSPPHCTFLRELGGGRGHRPSGASRRAGGASPRPRRAPRSRRASGPGRGGQRTGWGARPAPWPGPGGRVVPTPPSSGVRRPRSGGPMRQAPRAKQQPAWSQRRRRRSERRGTPHGFAVFAPGTRRVMIPGCSRGACIAGGGGGSGCGSGWLGLCCPDPQLLLPLKRRVGGGGSLSQLLLCAPSKSMESGQRPLPPPPNSGFRGHRVGGGAPAGHSEPRASPGRRRRRGGCRPAEVRRGQEDPAWDPISNFWGAWTLER